MEAPLLNDLDVGVLSKLIEGSGISFKPGKQSWIFDCPRCGRKQKLYIRRRDGRFKCFYCAEIDNFQGRPEFALQELLGLSLHDLRFKLYGLGIHSDAAAHLDLELNDFWSDEDESPSSNDDPMEPVVFPYHYYALDHAFSKKGVAYLEGTRGLPIDVCRQYGVRYSPIQQRVVFPLVTNGVLYGWQARSILPHTEWYDDAGNKFSLPKIVTSTGAPRDRLLMFYDRTKDQEHLIVTEGPVDAMKCHLLGSNVATMGKAVSSRQARLIMEHAAKDLYLALDPDAAEETARLVRDMGEDRRVFLLEPARGFKDLGAMSMEGVVEQFHRARRVTAGHLFLYFKYG